MWRWFLCSVVCVCLCQSVCCKVLSDGEFDVFRLSSLHLAFTRESDVSVRLDSSMVPLASVMVRDDAAKGCWQQCRAVRSAVVPALFFAGSALSWPYREDYRESRNRYVNDFENHYDDFLQHVPTLGVVGLNLAGVKGRHTLSRAAVNMAYSNLLMIAFVNVLKYNTHVMRPDNTTDNSFPSGHTATAFVGATALHKEYGTYRDPMYSVFAYSMALGTGMGRQLNNRHWISDVLAGAGIGILSTELGYWLAEKLHGNWGLNGAPVKNGFVSNNYRPSFIEMKLGMAHALSNSINGQECQFTGRGFVTGMEGAWFWNRYFGVGGQFMVSNFPFKEKGLEAVSNRFLLISDGAETQALGVKAVCVGPYADYPLNEKWALMGKVNIGYAQGFKGKHFVSVKPDYQKLFGERMEVAEFNPGQSWMLNGGLALRRIISQTVSAKFFIESGYSNVDWQVARMESVNVDTGERVWSESESKGNIRSLFLAYGFALSAIIW
ncbi:membrane-associated phospholipid phosphatase [Breznakibacter xylanolyticus]|uniref:Membrane-associated phospholipid phosphatase n=1 Tax=Breznakibacter xylanolyticus TaxID=990 RepID=A0A2W7Q6Q8_9BACT|nr:phosphatase PAP2 family protein [Breznakibacter xylanolyticus]PZX17439.1 membrane-associated phospholipid phosphatase [Breznakibacter xylanolyticus]